MSYLVILMIIVLSVIAISIHIYARAKINAFNEFFADVNQRDHFLSELLILSKCMGVSLVVTMDVALRFLKANCPTDRIISGIATIYKQFEKTGVFRYGRIFDAKCFEPQINDYMLKQRQYKEQ